MPVSHLDLTRTERYVLRAIVRRGSVVEAAREMERKLSTTRTHVRNIHRKIGSHSLGELIRWAMEHPDVWTAEERAS